MSLTDCIKASLLCSVMAAVISGCGPSDPSDSSDSSAPVSKYVDGTHEVSAKGKTGEVVLNIKVEGGKILDITTVSHKDTKSIFLNAERLIPRIIERNGHEEIDAITGATWSSNGILAAVNELPRLDGSKPKYIPVGSSDDAGEPFTLKWSIKPEAGLLKGDYYYEEERFRQGHLGSVTVVLDSKDPSDVIFVEFNEDGRPNYYLRMYQDVPKRMSEYNFSMGKKKGTAWVQSALTMERMMVEKDKLTFEENPDYDPDLANMLKQPNRFKYLGLDIVSGASNSIQQSLIPLAARIHARISEGTPLKFYQHAEPLNDEDGEWIGQTALLRFVVDTRSKKIVDVYYDEIFADEKSQIADISLKKFYRQSKYQSVMYEEPARIGFNIMMDTLKQHILDGGSMFDIEDMPATGDTGSYATSGFTKLSPAWANYLKQADILYREMRADGVISEHAK